MRILITGAAGFAGGHLLEELLRAAEHEITAGTFEEHQIAPVDGTRGAAVRTVHLDVTSDESLRAAVGSTRPERIYHLAGQASVGRSFQEPLETWEINATGTLRLLEAVRHEGLPGTRILVVSSAEVYGSVAEKDQPTSEAHPLRPVTPYGASKAAAEMAAVQCAAAGVAEVVVARSFNHIGPGQDDRFVLPSLARQLVRIRRGEAEPTLRVGNLDVLRDFLDVRDVVRAYTCLLERGESAAAYNVCSGTAVSLYAVVERLVELSGTDAELRVDPERVRPIDIPALVGDSSRLRALGWEPMVPLDRTLEDLLSAAEAQD